MFDVPPNIRPCARLSELGAECGVFWQCRDCLARLVLLSLNFGTGSFPVLFRFAEGPTVFDPQLKRTLSNALLSVFVLSHHYPAFL
jgi:hypothetical protein